MVAAWRGQCQKAASEARGPGSSPQCTQLRDKPKDNAKDKEARSLGEV